MESQPFNMAYFMKAGSMKIKILNQSNQPVWSKTIDEAEYKFLKAFRQRIEPVLPNWSIFFIPSRTDSVKHALMDCLSPIVFNSLYYEGWPSHLSLGKKLEFIPAILMELITLPVRLITVIPRAIYNTTKPQHPLLAWFQAENVPGEYTSAESIQIQLKSDLKSRKRCTKIDFCDERQCRIDLFTTEYYNNSHTFSVNFGKPYFLFRQQKDKARKYTEQKETTEEIIPFKSTITN